MQTNAGSPDLIQLVKTEVSLLHQLHILSQTESLILEKSDLQGLEEVVVRKRSIVEALWTHIDSLDSCLQSQDDVLSALSSAQKEELELLRGEANHLIQRIAKVDDDNLKRLDSFKSEAVEDSHLIRQSLAIHKAYAPSHTPTSRLSQFVD